MTDFFEEEEPVSEHSNDDGPVGKGADANESTANDAVARSIVMQRVQLQDTTQAGNLAPTSAYERDLPEPAEWSAAAVRLLQGVVYHDDNAQVWDTLLRSVSPLTDYFGKLGLLLVVDETDGMAYLRQIDEEDVPPDYPSVPRLFRRTPMSYDTTLLCVLLRDSLRIFEEEDVQNERCVVSQNDLLALWQAFFPAQKDEVRLNRTLVAALRKLEELKFVRQFEQEPPSWEVRRIIKARLSLDDLERLRHSLVAAAASKEVAESDPIAPTP